MGIAPPLLVATAVAAVAWRAGALDRGGAVAAGVLGAVTLSVGGWPAGIALIAFFLPSSAISRLWPGPVSTLDPKGDQRDAWQVFANGGAPVAALVLGGPAAFLAFAAGLAAAAADTWATAVGIHSSSPPRHILSSQKVPPGSSGGVTPLGTAGAAAGAVLVAVSAMPSVGWDGVVVISAIGVAGMLLDSALGAGLQGRFRCDQCDQTSERRVHRCGSRTRQVGGWALLNNDGVNALATLAATAAGWAAAGWWGRLP